MLAYCEARKTGKSDWDTIDILMRRSTDGGHTWSERRKVADVPGPKPRNPVAIARKQAHPEDTTYNNPVCIASANGTVHLLFCLEYMRCFYCRSDDDGVSWSRSANLDANAANDAREDSGPVVVTDGKGRWGVVWHSWGGISYRDGSDADILASFSDDDAKTWSAPTPLDRSAARDTSDDLLPSMATDEEGHWVSVWQTYFPSTGSVTRAEWRMIVACGGRPSL